ncbi:hypothetical protein [Kitasatospora sp. NPDC090308]|uniref:hypothetical protein n=1 Tax=Kitasatospora sp. NPDC090308 TaxID=3364082 RepID=UPI00380216ED
MTAEPIDWVYPPANGWTFDQVNELDLPFKWELVDGAIGVKGQTLWWHDREQGVHLPVAVHEGALRTELPFPVEIDLKRLVKR